SSTAAALLAERRPGGVIGLTMQLWDQRRLQNDLPVVHAGRCCSIDDAYDARRVAAHLGIPFYLVNFESRFEADVVRPFVESYFAGETPIPCTLCNNFVKFDQLLATARQIGAGRLATGHYARVRHNPAIGRYELRRALDPTKDQSYFLFGLTQDQLAATEFPLGELTKAEVRELARARRLPVAEKPESQEICFVPNGNYVNFLEAYLAEQGSTLASGKGEIVTTDGDVLGEHTGLHQFTVGQRRGLGVAAGKPLYVIALDRKANRVLVGDEADLYRREAFAREPNWISVAPPAEPVRALVKVRHKHTPAPATITPVNGHLPRRGRGLRILFDQPQRALTPGQAAVFYSADPADSVLVLGGAWLTESR
ncbi:MAG: tRNA 2-thiouridine(34) synthase MnmA, partial [Candidatus Acidiferrales bacterium]